MNRIKIKLPQLLIAAAVLVLLNACALVADPITKRNTTATEGWQCIETLDVFLYQMITISRYERHYKVADILPTQPWQLVADLPAEDRLVTYVSKPPKATYFNHAIWIALEDRYRIYDIETGTFTTRLMTPVNGNGAPLENIMVENLFVIGSDLYGVNNPTNYDSVRLETLPLLSVFDRQSRQFKLLDIGLTYLADEKNVNSWVITYDTTNAAVWMYHQRNGLYRFTPADAVLKQYAITLPGAVKDMTVSNEGMVLFQQEIHKHWVLNPGELVLFDPSDGTLSNITVPFFPWSNVGRLFFTRTGELWLGIHGFRKNNGGWVLKNPYEILYLDLGAESTTFNWVQPQLISQSSNGYLWFSEKPGDGLGVSGTAWYDPATDSGCWFTTEPAGILEDDHGNLWLVTDNQIYQFPTE